MADTHSQPNSDDKESLITDASFYAEDQDAYLTPRPACPASVDYHPSLSHNVDSLRRFVSTLAVILLSTIATVMLPPYLDAANAKSDVYCALLLTSFVSVLCTAVVVAISKCRSRDRNFRCPVSVKSALKLGMLLAISGLCIFYSRDRSRVLCHLQDPLAAAVLPMAVVAHFLFSPKADNTRKLFCLAATIIGLFICIDFQIWDEFTCHGHANMEFLTVKRQWSSDENAIWTIVYLAGFAALALFLIHLDKEMKGNKPQCLVATIALTPTSSTLSHYCESYQENLCESLLPNPDVESHGKLHSIPYFAKQSTKEFLHSGQVLVLSLWIQVFAFLTILASCWTNLFSFLGKAGSTVVFEQNMRSLLLCHFTQSDGCSQYLMVEWIFVLSSAALMLSIVFFVTYSGTCSAPYLTSLLTTALPLSAFCWSLFKTENGFQWDPSFTGETGFTIVGLPIMIIALSLYRYYANKESRKHFIS